jgi:hypothetical protein
MAITENPALTLEGRYHDVLYGPDGAVVWDRGWHKNAIAVSCRRLLASFLKADPTALGIDGLMVGAGSPAWDAGAPPPPTPTSVFFDLNPTKVPRVAPPPGATFQMDYLDGPNVSALPTNRLQINIKLGPGVPAWPDGSHTTSSLREFGLVGRFGGADVMLNYVTHPVITKDPFSTLERTIWLVF